MTGDSRPLFVLPVDGLGHLVDAQPDGAVPDVQVVVVGLQAQDPARREGQRVPLVDQDGEDHLALHPTFVNVDENVSLIEQLGWGQYYVYNNSVEVTYA